MAHRWDSDENAPSILWLTKVLKGHSSLVRSPDFKPSTMSSLWPKQDNAAEPVTKSSTVEELKRQHWHPDTMLKICNCLSWATAYDFPASAKKKKIFGSVLTTQLHCKWIICAIKLLESCTYIFQMCFSVYKAVVHKYKEWFGGQPVLRLHSMMFPPSGITFKMEQTHRGKFICCFRWQTIETVSPCTFYAVSKHSSISKLDLNLDI